MNIWIFEIEMLVLAGILEALAILMLKANENNIAKLEKLCRNKVAGLLLSLPCALLCVPLAVPVSPGFLIGWLYPLAIVLPVLSYFFLDYYASRGIAFLLIIASYDIIHAAFEIHLPGAAVITVIMMFLSIAGIWIAAKPCTLRDIFRKAAKSKVWKISAAVCGFAGTLCALYMLIMMFIAGVSAR